MRNSKRAAARWREMVGALLVVIGALVSLAGVHVLPDVPRSIEASSPLFGRSHSSSETQQRRGPLSLENEGCPEGTTAHFTASRTHGHMKHCVCTEDGTQCEGPKCSTALEHCETHCVEVSGFLSTCTSCRCAKVTESVAHAPPQQIFLSVADNGHAFSVNFAVKEAPSVAPHVIVWLERPQEEAFELGQAAFPRRRLRSRQHDDASQQERRREVVVNAVQREDQTERQMAITLWTALVSGFEGERVCYVIVNGNAVTDERCTHIPATSIEEIRDGYGVEAATIGVVGDIGMSYSAPFVVQALKLDPTPLDLLVHPGDVSYAFDVGEMNLYLNRMQGLISYVPYVVSLGNHESNNPSVLAAFLHRFPTDVLGDASNSSSGRWYSFQAYSCHIAVIDTMSSLAESTNGQIEWLESDLAQALRGKAGGNPLFTIVVLHYPLYSTHRRADSNQRREKQLQMAALRSALEPLFTKYAVDIVLAGHDHVYERTENTLGAKRNADGPIHLTVGTGGHNIYESWYNLPDYDVYRRAVPGYGRLTIFRGNATALWEFVEVDIDPCVRADYGGLKDCPLNHLHSVQGDFSPRTSVVDYVWITAKGTKSRTGRGG